MNALNRTTIDRRSYKGFDLQLCWCGYPQTRWLVMDGCRWVGTCMFLKEAKKLVDRTIAKNHERTTDNKSAAPGIRVH